MSSTEFLNGSAMFQEICEILAIVVIRAEQRNIDKSHKGQKKPYANSKVVQKQDVVIGVIITCLRERIK